uniref:F-box domain-containing protein n=1 Tax=Panagrolaimus sp. ES5 TaxID=591445 RepID=A0AC34FJK4_9BILA
MNCFKGLFFKRKAILLAKNPVDLSKACPDVLREIFLRLPKKDIINCRKVCRKWNNATYGRQFWLAKEKYARERYLRRLIDSGTPLFSDNFAFLSIKRPFNRNLLATYNLYGEDEVTRNADPRWEFSSGWRFIVAPLGLGTIRAGFENKFNAGHEIYGEQATKSIKISIDDLGITPEAMDQFRPPIIFSEWLAVRTLSRNEVIVALLNVKNKCVRLEAKDMSVNTYHGTGTKKWNHVEIVLKSYPVGVRTIAIAVRGGCGLITAGSRMEIKTEETPPPLLGIFQSISATSVDG